SEVSYLLSRPYRISWKASPVLVSSRSRVDSCRMVLITRFPLIVCVDAHGNSRNASPRGFFWLHLTRGEATDTGHHEKVRILVLTASSTNSTLPGLTRARRQLLSSSLH